MEIKFFGPTYIKMQLPRFAFSIYSFQKCPYFLTSDNYYGSYVISNREENKKHPVQYMEFEASLFQAKVNKILLSDNTE